MDAVKVFSFDEVNENPIAFQFKSGEGFKYVGALPMPANPLAPSGVCEPSVPADTGSWHRLLPPNQPDTIYVRAQWDAERKYWMPPLMQQGRRVSYQSAYLAAHGWTYKEAE